MAVSMVGLGVMELVLLLGMGGGAGLPLGVPPLPEDPILARIAPAECLFYAATFGMATPDPKSGNQTEQLLAEPEIQKLAAEVERLIRAAISEAAKREGPEAAALAEEAPGWVKLALTRPLAVYVGDVRIQPGGPPDVRAGAVLNAGDDAPKVKATLDRFLTKLPPNVASAVQIGGETFYRLKPAPDAPDFFVGVRGKYVIAGVGQGEVEGILERARGEAPAWLAAVRKQLPIERTSSVSTVNLAALVEKFGPLAGPQFAAVMAATGLNSLERVSSVSGLDQTGFVGKTLIGLRGEPQGLFALTGQQSLGPADLAVIPADATFAFAGKCSLADLFKAATGVIERIEPRAKQQMLEGIGQVEQQLGLKLVEDVLEPIGDTWRLYDSPSEGGLGLGVTAVVSLKDPAKAAATHDKLLQFVQMLMAREGGDPRRAPRIETIAVGQQKIHFLNAREREFPFAPAWCLTDKELIVALFPQSIKAILNRQADFQSLAKAPAVAAAMGGDGTVMLSYLNSRRVFEWLYPMLPIAAQAMTTELQREGIDVNVGLLPSAATIHRHILPTVSVVRRTAAGIEATSHQTVPGIGSVGSAPILVALLLPAVQAAREAARRTQSMNNLKQIALAMHNYEATYRGFPPAFKADKEGKPLLSWRVLILPFVEEEALYRQFHLDEPWDSEHNKKLIEKMPMIYRSPNSAAKPGMSSYLTIRGEKTAFPGGKAVRMADIVDGTSNTIMAVEVPDARAVIWTRPDDFEFDEKDPIKGLLGLRAGGFVAAMCDGSVRFIAQTIDGETLRRLFLRNDGQVINMDF